MPSVFRPPFFRKLPHLVCAASLVLLAGCMDKSPETQLDWGLNDDGWDTSTAQQPAAPPPAQTADSTQLPPAPPAYDHANDRIETDSLSTLPAARQPVQTAEAEPASEDEKEAQSPAGKALEAEARAEARAREKQTTEKAAAPRRLSSATPDYTNAPIHREKPTGTEPPHAPRALSTQHVDTEAKPKAAEKPVAVASAEKPVARVPGAPAFVWPLHGKILDSFGESQDGSQNDGINIAASKGEPIRAAASGTVEYAGNGIAGYGNLVLIRHNGNYFTAYAHADQLKVHKGDPVMAGQVIGYAGTSGDVTTPQLHFEIRHGKKPVNPSRYLGKAAQG